ncbi:MAG: DUF72 domain-containing protein [Saprospiraceae bacterium]
MEFGKPENPALIDWSLAPDTDLTNHVLEGLSPPLCEGQRTKPNTAPHIYLGSTSWGDKEYVGPVYPPKTKAKEFLEAYGKQFNTIELNTTFYRMPKADQTAAWADKVPSDFRFCPKVNKLLSQSKNLGVGTNRIEEYCEGVRGFGENLGPCFIQLPTHFDTSKFEALLAFLDQWPSDVRLAVELRHASWFTESRGADLFAELFARGHGTTISDVGTRRDVAHMNITTDFFLLRWVGSLHSTDQERLAEWSAKLASWISGGLTQAYVFTHQVVAPEAAKAASSFEDMLRAHYPAPLNVRSPEIRTNQGPQNEQIELFG